MAIVIITHCGLPNGPRKEYPFLHFRMATILKDGSITGACITKSFPIAIGWWNTSSYEPQLNSWVSFLFFPPQELTARSRWWHLAWYQERDSEFCLIRLWKSTSLPLVLASKARRQSWWLKNQQRGAIRPLRNPWRNPKRRKKKKIP